jgi:serine/threonine-protein kinase
MEMLAELSRGTGTGQLETGEVIGEGGMGVIRAATQVALGRGVAVKTLKPGKREPAAALDLLREAWVTGAIEHPNVVPVHYLEVDADGVPVIVMKRIAGVEWSALLGDAGEVERRFGATDLLVWNLGILMSVLNALRYAHSRGVVHRDLKPSNVMIGDFGEVYLLDWGIAVSLRDDGSGRLPLAANAIQLAGTPHYMAPEMLGRSGSAPISERTDVYLAGAVLFEVIAGRPPHQASSIADVFASVLASAPVMPAGVPPELAAICLRAMHADADARFASVDLMRLAIQSYLEHRGSADLATRASVRLAELVSVLAKPADAIPDSDGDADRREAIYRLFGACRFGFHEALSVWPDNVGARDGLVRATTAVAEYELADGNPRVALTLLGELADAPVELVARARAEVEAASRHQAALEKLRSEHDPSLGRRTRTFLSVLLGVTFTVLPLINGLTSLHTTDTHRRDALLALGTLGVMACIAVWARNTMRATAFNRHIAASGLFIFVGQVILSLGASALGMSVVETQVIMIFFWGAVAAVVTISVDVWLWPSAVLYFVWFAIAAARPELRFYAMAGGNLGFAINAFVRWTPATFRPTEEERRAREARDARARGRRRRTRSG